MENTDYEHTGTYKAKNMIIFNLSLQDLLYAVVLGVMGGFISTLIPISEVMKLIYPFVGGQQLLSGHHYIWMSVSYGIVRKKSAPIITAAIKGVLESILGDEWGVFILFMNILEGTVLALVFWMMEKLHESDTKFGWSIAGGVATFIQAPIFWGLNGRYGIIENSIMLVAFIFAFISGVLITGLLGKMVSDLINKSMSKRKSQIVNTTASKNDKQDNLSN